MSQVAKRESNVEVMAPASGDAGSLMEIISRAANDPNTDVDKLERLMAMYERITARGAQAAYAEALASMQPELPVISERGKIQIGTGKAQMYALWEDINEAIRPVLARFGFSLSFRTGQEDGKIVVTGILSHKGGHSEQTTMHLPIDASGSKNAVQAVGSSTSYGKRYTAQALLNLTSRGEDDDGKAAGAGGYISEIQVKAIRALMEETATNEKRFCGFMKVEKIEDIPAAKYQTAVDALNEKKETRVMMQIIECEQGTSEWYEARRGIPTASEFGTILTPAKSTKAQQKTRRTYMLKLAGEILLGEPMEHVTTYHMERGKVMEDEARNLYAMMRDVDPVRVGFIVNGKKGCSPDSLIERNGSLEVKTKLPHLMIDVLLADEFPEEHKAQSQGVIWTAEREWIDIAIYWPRLPLFIKRAYRDEAFIKTLSDEVDRFNDELHETVEKIRRYGTMPAEKAA